MWVRIQTNSWNILLLQVKNENKDFITGTVRIFMAPKIDERKTEMRFNTIRKMFVELDKFTYKCEYIHFDRIMKPIRQLFWMLFQLRVSFQKGGMWED